MSRAIGILWLVPLAAFAVEATGGGSIDPAWRAWANTLLMAGTCAALSVALGLPAAAALAHAPRLAPLVVAPLILPPVVAASAWMGMRFPSPGPAACGAILAATLWPLPALFGWASLRRLPRAELEAASLQPGSPLFRIVWPHARPAVAASALLVFLLAASEFTVPAAFAVPTAGTRIYEHLYAFQVREAALTALPLLVLAGAAAVLLRRVPAFPRAGEAAGFLSPAARRSTTALTLAATGLTALLPALVFAWTLRSPAAYVRAMAADGEGLLWGALFAAATAAIVTLWSVCAKGRSALEPLWVASLLLPGLVPALGVLSLGLPTGSGWLLVWSLASRFAVVAWLPLREAVNPSQLEAAEVSGLGRARIWRRIVLPALFPRALAAGLVVFALATAEIGPAVLLAPPGRQTGVQRLFNALHYGYDGTAAALALSLVAGAAALAWMGAYAWRVARS